MSIQRQSVLNTRVFGHTVTLTQLTKPYNFRKVYIVQ